MNHSLRLRRTLSMTVIGTFLVCVQSHAQESAHCEPAESSILHYCNLDDPGLEANSLGQGFPGGTAKFGPDSRDEGGGGAAQIFTAGDSNQITSITIGLARAGMPGGKLVFSIFEVDSSTGYPGTDLGVFAEIEIDSLPVRPIPNTKPLELVTVNGLFEGLSPGTNYYLTVDNDGDARVTGRSLGWAVESVGTPEEQQPVAFYAGGRWQRPLGPVRLRASIRGTATSEPLSDPFAVATTEDGIVTKVPEMESYLVGSEVTVTATPEEGFEFEKWTYGEEEFTTNPATITIQEGATLRPVFVQIEEPMPLQVDIEHAVGVSWDSQTDRVYQIHLSTDMESWEIAVDGIPGTGERLTECFIHKETEIFYRVEEAP